ncbi:MAG: pilin [Candidatus Moranbacteria bacterium]|nr:pilin [Candidatus Moranbacteria bacterium]
MIKVLKKNKNKKLLLSLFSLLGIVLPFLSAQAQTLSQIPGQESTTDDLIEYLNNFYKFGLSSIAILAVFMIAVGAFTYLVLAVGNPSKMQSAKEKITNALFGLALAFLAYLMLFVINPDLVSGTIAGLSEKTQEIQNNTKGNYWNNGPELKCGAAAGEYPADADSFQGKFCKIGELKGNEPSFPDQGGSVEWICVRQKDKGETKCRAERES